MFDMLVRLAAGPVSSTTALLHLKSRVGEKEVEKIFLSDAPRVPASEVSGVALASTLEGGAGVGVV